MAKYFRKLKSWSSKILVIVSVVVSVLTSCTNSDDIGDLLGQWKLETVTYQKNTIKPDNLYLCFQSQYVCARIVDTHGSSQTFGHYINKGNTMTMKFYYSEAETTTYPTDPHNSEAELTNYMFFDNGTPRTQEDIDKGIYPVNLSFSVEVLNSDQLILSNADGRWIFSKW